MRLIFMYGPPAAGKLTIGQVLEAHTNFRLFHNHLTVNVGRAIFEQSHMPHPDPRYVALLKQLRLDCIKAAAAADIDLIFTLAYSGAVDDSFVADIVKAVETQGGEVCFVQLTPPTEILLQRISNTSRQELGKLADPTVLQQTLAERDMRASVHYPHLSIDTSTVRPAEAAKQIIDYFQLSVVNNPS